MTIPYPDSFSLALIQWKGSLYKAVIKDLLVFYLLYYVVFVVNMWILDEDGKAEMTKVIVWFEKGTGFIPLTFLLGFFVAGVVARWWEQFNWISWPDKLMLVCGLIIPDDKFKTVRMTIARWSNLQAALAWSAISVRTKKRFPTMQHYVDAKLMTPSELKQFEAVPAPYGKWFLPTMWIGNVFKELYQRGDIDTVQQKMLFKQLMSYRDGFATLFVYDWINIPLVYTQVVAIATYGFFALCLIARQPKLDELSQKNEATILFPIFTTLQMLFYIGWLKVGQYLMHPFGEDEDDFELNWILDRNTSVAYMMADEALQQMPKLDSIVSEKALLSLPHTRASVRIKLHIDLVCVAIYVFMSKYILFGHIYYLFWDVPPADNLASIKIRREDMALVSEEEAKHALLDHTDDDEEMHGGDRFRQLVRTLSGRRHRANRAPNDVEGTGMPPPKDV